VADELRIGLQELLRKAMIEQDTSFLWALCHELVRSTTHLLVAQKGAGLPFLEISHESPRSPKRSRLRAES
jgi:hypothetical protein